MTELEPRRSGLRQLAEAVRQITAALAPVGPRPVQAHAERVDETPLQIEPGSAAAL
jgi:hypothetical protein